MYTGFAAAIVVAYLLGSVPFAFLIAWAHGKDLRTIGSGNIGATNLARAVGRTWGYTCFALDVLKGLAPVAIVGAVVGVPESPGRLSLWLLVGAAAILGHVFPVYLRFKGGKGVATSFGVALGLWPYFTLLRRDRPAGLGGRRPDLALHLAGVDLCGRRLSDRPGPRNSHPSQLACHEPMAPADCGRSDSHTRHRPAPGESSPTGGRDGEQGAQQDEQVVGEVFSYPRETGTGVQIRNSNFPNDTGQQGCRASGFRVSPGMHGCESTVKPNPKEDLQ